MHNSLDVNEYIVKANVLCCSCCVFVCVTCVKTWRWK